MRRDALGLPDGGDEEAVEEGERVAVQLVGGAAVIFEIARDGDGVGARLFHRLAGVARLELRDFVGVVFDEARRACESSRPRSEARRAGSRRRLEGAARGGDGEIDVGLVARGDRGERRRLPRAR